MNVHATIDGRPVALTDWQCDSTINWGYRSLTGKVPESVTWAEQEAPVQLWLPDGTELWAGKLALDPDSDRGKLAIRAEGYASDIAASKTRMHYRIDGGSEWSGADEDPFQGVTGEVERIDVDTRPGALHFRLLNDKAYSVGDASTMLIWVEGSLVTKLRYVFHKLGTGSVNFDIRTNSFTGPTGSQTVIDDLACNSADGTERNVTISTPEDAVMVRTRCNTAFTPTARNHFWLTGVRVYGRTTDNNFSAGEVVADVGSDAGLNTDLVQTNSLAILPLDWTDDHPALLDYMADLADWHWEAIGPNTAGVPQLAFGPWETTWTGYQTSGVKPTWENQKRYNIVRVPFRYMSGAEGTGEATADPDPFPGEEVVYWTDELEHPQPDALLADAVAAAQVPHWASRRAAGRVEIGEVTSATGEKVTGYHVRPGHLLDVPERSDLGPQRIVGMTYRETGFPTADINDDFNVIRLLNEVKVARKRRRRRRRRRPPKRP